MSHIQFHKPIAHSRFNWPPWILVPSYEPGGAPIHIEIEDAKPLTDKDQIFDMKDDWHRLRSIPCQRGLAMQKRITSRHTKITTTMTCPNMKTPSDQDDQEFVIELAAEALEYGQLVYGPAALAGRIVDHADGVVYSEFATETVPVPSPPSPGWLPGEVDWKTEVLSPGRPKLELQVYSHGADHDIWDTFFLRTAINWYIGSMRSRGIEKAVFTKPSFDIQLVPPPRAGIKFPLSDQVALLNALKDFQRQHQARIVDFHMLSDGVVVAIGSLDPNNPKYWGPAD